MSETAERNPRVVSVEKGLAWFLSIHAPVPLVVLTRVVCALGWHLVTLPVFVSAFFTGQYLGGILRRRGKKGRLPEQGRTGAPGL